MKHTLHIDEVKYNAKPNGRQVMNRIKKGGNVVDAVNSCERDFQDVVQAMEGLQGLGLDSGEAYRVLEARKEALEKEAGTILNEITPLIHRSEDEYQGVKGC